MCVVFIFGVGILVGVLVTTLIVGYGWLYYIENRGWRMEQ
jgi:hypothetical protein